MANGGDYSNFDWGNLGLWGGPSGAMTQEIDPEQFARQGAYSYPIDLPSINTMAGQGGGGGATVANENPLYYGPAATGSPSADMLTSGATSQQVAQANSPQAPTRGNPAANYARMFALLGGIGTGAAGLVTANQNPTLPGQVKTALKQAQTGTGPQDPNAQYNYDLARAQKARQLAKEMGPGWATSTPGIQAMGELERNINADVYARQLGQQQVGLQTVNALTQPLVARQAASSQGYGQLAGTLGTLGYLGLS